MPSKICVMGCGPGHPDYLSPIVTQKVRSADFVMGCSRTASLFPQMDIFITDGRYGESLQTLENKWKSGLSCVVLVTGDVGLFSLASTLRRHFSDDILECHPGISSVQYAASKLGINWNDLQILSAHGREIDTSHFRDDKNFVILAGGSNSEIPLRNFLHPLNNKYRFLICSNLSLENEKITPFELDSLAEILQESLSLIVGVVNPPVFQTKDPYE